MAELRAFSASAQSAASDIAAQEEMRQRDESQRREKERQRDMERMQMTRQLAPYNIAADQCQLVGKGSFGRVFRFCKFPPRRIALKLVDYSKEKAEQHGNIRQTVKFEAQLGKMMGELGVGPHVYSVQFDDVNKTALIGMEFMDINLHTFFKKSAPVLEGALEDLEQRLTRVLDRMARAGIKCLDLKPENVMVNVDKVGNIDKVRIIDFDTRFCQQHESIQNNPENAILAMKTMLAAVTHKVKKTLLFVEDLASLDDAMIDALLEDKLFTGLAKHYLQCAKDAIDEKACIKKKLDALVSDARDAKSVASSEGSSPGKRKASGELSP